MSATTATIPAAARDAGQTARLSVLALPMVLAGYLLLALFFSYRTPLLEAPDEPGHLGYINHLVERQELPMLATEMRGSSWERFQPPLYYLLMAGLLRVFHGGPLDLSLKNNPEFFLEGGRSIPRFLHAPGETGGREAQAFLLLRAIQSLFGLLTVYFTYRLSLLVAGHSLALLSAVVVAGLPQFLYISSVLNNDNLANCLAALALFVVVKTWRDSDACASRAVLLGLVCGAALLTKLTAAFLLPSVAVVLALAATNRRNKWVLPAVALAVAGITGGWFLLWQFSICGARACVPDLPLTGSRLVVNASFWKLTAWSFSGFFGWMAIPLERACRVGVTLLWLTGLGATAWAMARRRAPGIVILTALLATAGLAQFLWYAWFFGLQPQGRYLFVALPVLASIWAYGLGGRPGRARLLVPLLGASLLVLNFRVIVGILPRLGLP